jgi:Flp pilus assembly protein TadG
MRKLFFTDKNGQSLIEFALLLPILLLVFFGITEFGRATMVKNILVTASREGARLAAVSTDSSSVKARVEEVLQSAGIDPDSANITIIYQFDENNVEVTVSTNFKVLAEGIFESIIIPDPFTLTGKTVMRYEG